MRYVVLIVVGLLFCGSSPPPTMKAADAPLINIGGFSDFPTVDPQWKSCVYLVRIRAYSSDPQSYGTPQYPQGSGVSIGGGRILTANHIADRCQAGFVVEVEIDGQFVKGQWQPVAGYDLAIVQLPNDLPGVEIRDPVYGEALSVYGKRTNTIQTGMNSDDQTASLYVEEQGIDFGDSGGGLFGDDGKLVGIIRAKNPNQPRVVYFTPAKAMTVASAPVAATPKTRPTYRRVCQGGRCYMVPQ